MDGLVKTWIPPSFHLYSSFLYHTYIRLCTIHSPIPYISFHIIYSVHHFHSYMHASSIHTPVHPSVRSIHSFIHPSIPPSIYPPFLHHTHKAVPSYIHAPPSIHVSIPPFHISSIYSWIDIYMKYTDGWMDGWMDGRMEGRINE